MSFRYLLLLAVFFFVSFLSAQFGITGLYQQSQDKFTSLTNPDGGSMGGGFEIAVDYWFRLPKKRIEFLPTLSYGNYSNTISVPPTVTDGPVALSYGISEIGFQFKTNFYLLDFGTDCDCPTFGKQGPALHKGLFLQLAPGISRISGSNTYDVDERTVKDGAQFIPNVGVGLGIDFGVSNLITITPLVSYRFGLSEYTWGGLIPPCDTCDIFSEPQSVSALQAGIRVGIRLDERRY